MSGHEIETRYDVFKLADTFYRKVSSKKLLSPIFEAHIDEWLKHIIRFTDFWETNLFFVRKFKGNSLLKHQIVATTEAHPINELHFGTWLNIWFVTTDELFVGENA